MSVLIRGVRPARVQTDAQCAISMVVNPAESFVDFLPATEVLYFRIWILHNSIEETDFDFFEFWGLYSLQDFPVRVVRVEAASLEADRYIFECHEG